jgi:molecular chaperone HscA
MDVIIARNSKIPVSAARNYTTSIDGQKNLRISIFQGERDLVENNRKLGEFILRDIPPMAAGIPKIEISFIIDADGILKVRAKELRSQKMQQIEIRSTYGISEEEMAKMLLDSLTHAQEDIAVKALLEAINEANHIILSTEKFINQNQEIFDSTTLQQLDRYREDLRDSINSNNKNAIEKAMKTLNVYAEPLAHQAMDYQIANAIKGKSIGS